MDDDLTRTRPRRPGDGPGADGADAAPDLYLRLVFSEGRQPLGDGGGGALVDGVRWLDKGQRHVLGRGPDGASDVALPWDAWASRRHASAGMFAFGDERGVLVEDLGSSNGTFLDGAPVAGQTVARPGQVLRVGSSLFVVGAARRDEPASDVPAALHARAPAMRTLWRRARAVAGTEDPALLLGEPGTGKTLVARLLHEHSRRAGGPFIVLNSSAIPLHLEEATLFGVVPGFIPSVKQKTGLLTLAKGGTLFLDELADMPPIAQAKLLDAFDPTHRSFLPVGATQRVPTECRLVCATNRDVFALAAQGELRRDLVSRLAVGQLAVPPLRERREDIVPLYEAAVARAQLPADRAALSVEAAEALLLSRWTENVRGLESLVRQLVHGASPTPELIRAHADRGHAEGAIEPERTQAAPGSSEATAPRGAARALPAAPTAATVRWPPTPLEWFALLEAHQWQVAAIGDALEMRRETIARALTRTFGAGGKAAAQRAFEAWVATGVVPEGGEDA